MTILVFKYPVYHNKSKNPAYLISTQASRCQISLCKINVYTKAFTDQSVLYCCRGQNWCTRGKAAG